MKELILGELSRIDWTSLALSLDKEPPINSDNLIRDIARLHHPNHGFRDLFGITESSNGDSWSA